MSNCAFEPFEHMDTRTELLKSAENAARRRGYDGFSYADIANEVGIRKASIHHHFPSKADLAVALMERYAQTFSDALAVIDKTSDLASDRLSAYVQSYRRAMSGGKKLCLCVAFSASRDALSGEALAQLDAFHLSSIDWLVQTFDLAHKDQSVSGLSDSKDEAIALLALVEGAQIVARAGGKVSAYDQATRMFLNRLS